MTPSRVLLTSVCKPIGPSVGDGESVGYDLLHGQVTRSQHIYSPRVGPHLQWALDYIAANLDAPSVVLHYPSKRAFLEEVKKGYAFIGIGFVLATVHHTIAMCHLIRRHSPSTKIVLGGYGTVMSDDELRPHCDAICRGEGVAFMRNILGEPALPVEAYRHPDIRTRMRVFGIPAGHSALVFAGLGCPNGCDFCSTSHFFKRKHIRLLPTGEAIFDVMNSQKNDHPDVEYTILDEDFLLNKQRAHGFLNRCREENTMFSAFCFASVKALSQYTFDELLEMGVDGVWVGYEGKQSGYAKQQGADIDQLIRSLQDHGITVLTSMIIGIPYQTAEIAEQEFSGLMRNSPALCQFLIYGPTPGTPFYEKVLAEGLLHEDLASDRTKYYRSCTGFTAMVKHPHLSRKELETLQEELYRRDFEILGPSIMRVTEVKLNGWNRYRNHPNPLFREKAVKFRRKAATALALLPIAIFGPKIRLRNRIRYCWQFLRVFNGSSWAGRCYVLVLPIAIVGALITWVKVSLGLWKHPMTRTHFYYGRNSQKQPVKLLRLLLKIARSHPIC